MPNSKRVEAKETGYGDYYQRSVEIEAQALFGMKADDFYRRQVGLVLDEIPDSISGGPKLNSSKTLDPNTVLTRGFSQPTKFKDLARQAKIKVLDKCDLGLGKEKRVLDIAVGEGDTSRYLASTGAKVEARDLSKTLIDTAQERDSKLRTPSAAEATQQAIRAQVLTQIGEVNYGIGDMGDIKSSLPENQDGQFDTVSVLSRSFIYLLDPEKYQKALKDYNDLLTPGGKLVIQAREHIKKGDLPWSEAMGTKVDTNAEEDFIMRDEKAGVEYGWRKLGSKSRKLPSGITIDTGSRYFKEKDGTIHEMQKEPFDSDDLLTLKFLPLWRDMLEKAGFKNIGIKAQELSPDGTEIMYAIVAEKPKAKEVTGIRASVTKALAKLRTKE
jgi:SAM-dependent methyltransferase